MLVAAHVFLVIFGHKGDQLLLPAVGGHGRHRAWSCSTASRRTWRARAPSASSSAWPRRSCCGSASGWWRCWRSPSACATTASSATTSTRGPPSASLLLAATLFFGYEVNGARLWIDLGPVSVQPGEFLKIVLVIFIAAYLAETRTLLTSARLRIGSDLRPAAAVLPADARLFAVVMLIAVRLNDLGTALLFFGIFLTMLFVATGRRSYVLIGLLLFLGRRVRGLPAVRRTSPCAVNVWLDPFADPLDTGFQQVRAIYALGRGGAVRRGPRTGAGDAGRGPDDSAGPHRLHLHRRRRGARAARRVRAARLRGGARLPRAAHRGPRARRLQRPAGRRPDRQPRAPDADHHRRQHEARAAHRHHPAVRELRRVERAGQLPDDRPAAGHQPQERRSAADARCRP